MKSNKNHTEENHDKGNISLNTVLNAADTFRTCLSFKHIESRSY